MGSAQDKIIALLRGYGGVTTAGWQDEVQGAIQSVLPRPGHDFDPVSYLSELPSRYRSERDAAREDIAKARAAAPGWYTGGQGLGLGATMLLPVARAMNTVGNVGRVANFARNALPAAVQAGTMALASGAGHSEAENPQGVWEDATHAALWAAPLGFVAGGIGGELERLANAKRSAALQKAASEVDKGINSARGKLGGETQGGSRSGENLTRLGRRGSLTPQEAADLAVLEQRVGDNTVQELGPQLQRIDEAQQAYNDLVANRASDIAKKVSLGRAVEALKERSQRYLLPMAAGAALGQLFPGDKRSNAALGAGAGLGLRPTFRSFGRLAWTNPATVTNVTAPTLEGAGTLLTRSAPAIGEAAGSAAATQKPKEKSFFEEDSLFEPDFFEKGK